VVNPAVAGAQMFDSGLRVGCSLKGEECQVVGAGSRSGEFREVVQADREQLCWAQAAMLPHQRSQAIETVLVLMMAGFG
jgi:hypothetical protein